MSPLVAPIDVLSLMHPMEEVTIFRHILSVTVGDEEGEPEKADVVIPIRELDDVLMKDVGDRIASSGKLVAYPIVWLQCFP